MPAISEYFPLGVYSALTGANLQHASLAIVSELIQSMKNRYDGIVV